MDDFEPPIQLDLKSSQVSKDYIFFKSDKLDTEELFHHTKILLQDRIFQGNGFLLTNDYLTS